MDLIVTCNPGLESLLKAELASLLKLESCTEAYGALRISISEKQLHTLLLYSRIASRVLLPLKSLRVRGPQDLERGLRDYPFHELMTPKSTFRVQSTGQRPSELLKLGFSNLKIKDIICDHFRDRGMARPSVDKQDADFSFEAHFERGSCELSLDLIGFPLHRRGYRKDTVDAPLRENKAAALVQFVAPEAPETFLDPFCGSGTIVIEAALGFSKRLPPSAASLLKSIAVQVFPILKNPLHEAINAPFPALTEHRQFVGRDENPKAVEQARVAARRAGVGDLCQFEVGEALETKGERLCIVTDPPHGDRLLTEAESAELLSRFSRQLKHHAPQSRLGLVLPKGELAKSLGLRSKKKLNFGSSGEESQFLVYELFSGPKASAKNS